MRFGRQEIWVSGLAMVLAAAGTASAQSDTQSGTPSQPTAAQQALPDAPKVQTVPQMNSITPVGAALPEAPVASPKTPNKDVQEDGSAAPGAALPNSPQAAERHPDDGPAPELPAPGQGSSETERIYVNTRFVEIPFTVKDSKGKLVPGLTWRDVRIYEDGIRQDPKIFTVDPFPLSVAIVIDQSVTYDTMEKINTSLSALQGAFTPYDEVSVFTYNNGVKKQTDFTAAQSPRLTMVLENSKGAGREPLMGTTGPLAQTTMINNLQVDPNTTPQRGQNGINLTIPKEYHTLNDAILEAAKTTATAERGRRRVVYVISDGKEYGSKATQKEVIRYLLGNNVTVYATLVGDSAIPGMGFLNRIHIPLTMREDVLPKYTTATAGGFDAEFRPKGIQESFQRITNEVRAQYTVGYYTKQSLASETFRKTEVRVLRPGLTIIAPDGYYPSAFRARPQAPVKKTAAPVAQPATTSAPGAQ